MTLLLEYGEDLLIPTCNLISTTIVIVQRNTDLIMPPRNVCIKYTGALYVWLSTRNKKIVYWMVSFF